MQSFVSTKTGVLETFPHASADLLREITSFIVKDGGSVTVGALLKDASGKTRVERTDIPVAGNLPVLGLFFRSDGMVKLRADDLIVFATQHIIMEAE